jgi:hypothetical protein
MKLLVAFNAVRRCVSLLLCLAATPLLAQTADERAARFAALPDWSGIWVIAGDGGDIDVDGYGKRTGLQDWTILGFAAPYLPEVRARFERELPEILALSGRLKAQGWGFPIMMETATPLQFLITPEETLILNFYREARHVYTDGRALPPAEDRWPVPWGESAGHWEGDTLVVETVSVQQPGIFNIHLPLLSEEARYVERIRKTGPDRIESEMTIHDPATLAAPWVLNFVYERAAGFDRMFHMEFENDRTLIGEDGLSLTPEAVSD